jgi:hypothetical protein
MQQNNLQHAKGRGLEVPSRADRQATAATFERPERVSKISTESDSLL